MFQKFQRIIDYFFEIQTPSAQVRFKNLLKYFYFNLCIYQKFARGKDGFASDFMVEAIAIISPNSLVLL